MGAFKAGHRYSAREFIDENFAYELLKRVLDSNYSDTEAIEALDYLTKFNNEYHKAVIKKNDRAALHKTKKMRQERYNANNARNRDIMSAKKHLCESLEPYLEPYLEQCNVSDFGHEELEPESPLNSQEWLVHELIDFKNGKPG